MKRCYYLKQHPQTDRQKNASFPIYFFEKARVERLELDIIDYILSHL